MRIGSSNILEQMSKEFKETISEDFLPYLILDESADVKWFQGVMEDEGIDILLEWRYYYAYKDAIRIIDFVDTKGIYDAWVVFMPPKDLKRADELVKQYSDVLDYFEPAEEQFFRGLETAILKKALASQQMQGQSLDLALKILAEQNITYNLSEIQGLKKALVLRNAQRASKITQAKVIIWCLIIMVILIYLWLVGMFS